MCRTLTHFGHAGAMGRITTGRKRITDTTHHEQVLHCVCSIGRCHLSGHCKVNCDMPKQLLPRPAMWIHAAVAELYKLTTDGAEPQ